MTDDTKRALEIINPIAEALGMREVTADNKFLYADGANIGISGNSTYATVMEFIGVCAIRYCHKFRELNLTMKQLEAIKRYWFTPEQLERIGERE